MNPKPTFVFLACTQYSGSTLLSLLLGAHPQIATVGEIANNADRDVTEYVCSCREKLSDCEFWQEVRSSMRARGFTDFDLVNFKLTFQLRAPHPLLSHLRTSSLRNGALETMRDNVLSLWPGQISQLRQLGARNKAFAEAVLELTGKSVFLDASKERRRAVFLARYLDMDLRVIHLMRDVRGVVNSLLWHRNHSEKRTLTTRKAAQLWVNRNQVLLRSLREIPPEKQMLVWYEDLCSDVQGTLMCLYEFCGIDSAAVAEDFRTETQHVLGNRMRLSSSSEVKLDDRWRDSLTNKDLHEIEEVASPFLQCLKQSLQPVPNP